MRSNVIRFFTIPFTFVLTGCFWTTNLQVLYALQSTSIIFSSAGTICALWRDTLSFKEVGSCDLTDATTKIILVSHIHIRHYVITSVTFYICGSHGSDGTQLGRHVLTLRSNVLTAFSLQPWWWRQLVYPHWCYLSTNITLHYIPLHHDLNSVTLPFSSACFLGTPYFINPNNYKSTGV
jgi:hypothetical protein